MAVRRALLVTAVLTALLGLLGLLVGTDTILLEVVVPVRRLNGSIVEANSATRDVAVNSTGMTQTLQAKAKDVNASAAACLCIFDVDRTLTGEQEETAKCNHNLVVRGVWDPAYGGGTLTLSELGQGIRNTFCAGCYQGVVSAGNVGESDMKAVIVQILTGRGHLPNIWSNSNGVMSPLVLECEDQTKPACVRGVVEWYRSTGIYVDAQDVYFYDDKRGNVKDVARAGFNSHQVSCANRRRRRKYAEGLCGGTIDEIKQQLGITLCA